MPGGAEYGADEHSDLTIAQFSARFGGYSDDGAAAAAAAPAAQVQGDGSVDWRDASKNPLKLVAVTHVKNQGAFGTCWSFGVAENLEGLNVRQGNTLVRKPRCCCWCCCPCSCSWRPCCSCCSCSCSSSLPPRPPPLTPPPLLQVNISEQEFISCCKTCQGRSAENSFDWLANNTGGVPALEATYPYNGSAKAPCVYKTAPKVKGMKLTRWGRVVDDGTGAPVVAGLQVNGPMGMGVDATCFAGYKGGVIRNCTSKGVDHAVLMVAAGTDAGVKYFTIKNSWGQKWGEEGYVRIEQGKVWWGKLSMIATYVK